MGRRCRQPFIPRRTSSPRSGSLRFPPFGVSGQAKVIGTTAAVAQMRTSRNTWKTDIQSIFRFQIEKTSMFNHRIRICIYLLRLKTIHERLCVSRSYSQKRIVVFGFQMQNRIPASRGKLARRGETGNFRVLSSSPFLII